MFYLIMHSTYFIYGYMASDIWQRTTQIAREETRCSHYMGHPFRIATTYFLYAPPHSGSAMSGRCTTELHLVFSLDWLQYVYTLYGTKHHPQMLLILMNRN